MKTTMEFFQVKQALTALGIPGSQSYTIKEDFANKLTTRTLVDSCNYAGVDETDACAPNFPRIFRQGLSS